MTIKGTAEAITKLLDKVDSILGKIKWFGIAGTIILSITHYSACKSKQVIQDKFDKLSKTCKNEKR